MKVFVTGATGTLGRPIVQLLVKNGHKVLALSRSVENDMTISKLGGEPVRANLFHVDSLQKGMKDAEAVLHLATKIPATRTIGRQRAWLETGQIRREGTRNLVDVALEHEVKTFVYPSIVFLYPDCGDKWIDATMQPQPADYLKSTLVAEAEVTRFAKHDRRGISLRMGGFYNATSSQSKEMLRTAHMGFSPVFGRDEAYQPLIWINDAARAVVAALEAPSGVYDIVDDEPLTRGELRKVIAKAIGHSKLTRLPNFVTSLLLGVTAETLTRSQRVSNQQFKKVTSWQPEVPSAREGWKRIAAQETQTRG
jgi:nucleoside-diphosphate-sugar epimerase